MPKQTTKFLVLISHSLGELDVLLPLFARLHSTNSIKVELVIAVEGLSRLYFASPFLNYCAETLGIEVRHLKLPNKFDYRWEFHTTSRFLKRSRIDRVIARVLKLLRKTYLSVLGYWRLPFLFRSLLTADIYMHEISNQTLTTRELYRFSALLGKPIVSYGHGAGTSMGARVSRKIEGADLVTHLRYHEHDREFLSQSGFIRQVEIGYPQFYPEWQQLVHKFREEILEDSDHVLLLTRTVSKHYMDRENYIHLLKTSCEAIREKCGEILIVVKPHPREDDKFLREVLETINLQNFEISREHTAVLSRNAKIVIAFYSGAIFHPLSLGVPAVEYYIEAKHYREIRPKGSPYKQLGIQSVSNKEGLNMVLDQVLENKYVEPEIVGELSKRRGYSLEQFYRTQVKN